MKKRQEKNQKGLVLLNNFFIHKNKNPYVSAINKIKNLKTEKKEEMCFDGSDKLVDILLKEVVNGTDVFEIVYFSKKLLKNYPFLKQKHLVTKDFINTLLHQKYKIKVLDKVNNILLKNFF